MPHATLPSPGLQALILCGPGVSLNTFTSNPKDFPKALIPIANRPMVWYPLDWCYRMGVTDITLITPPESLSSLEAALATHPALTSLPSPKPEVLAPEDLMQTTGTGELLRLPEVQKCVTGDFVVLPCDLISEVEGTKFVQQWLSLNPLPAASDATKRKGGLSVFYPTHGLESISTKKDETDFLATIALQAPTVTPPQGSLRSNVEEIVMNMPTDTLNDKLEEDKGFFRLRQSLMDRHSRVKLRMKHRDAHVYIFPRWVMDFARRNEDFDSISEDVLGWWAKSGWQEGLGEKLSLPEIFDTKKDTPDDQDASHDEDDIDPSMLSSTNFSAPAPPPASVFASRVGKAVINPATPSKPTIPPLLAYVHPVTSTASAQPLIRRIDTSHQLLNVSLYLAKQSAATHVLAPEHKIHPTAKLEQMCRVTQEDSLIAENVTIGFRANIKESVIGANCTIGKQVRMTKCLLMDGAVIGDGVQLTSCIIGRRARIDGVKATEAPLPQADKKGKARDEDDKTRLTECEVAPNFVVEAGTEAKGEKLMAFETDEGLDEDDDDDDDEDDDDETGNSADDSE